MLPTSLERRTSSPAVLKVTGGHFRPSVVLLFQGELQRGNNQQHKILGRQEQLSAYPEERGTYPPAENGCKQSMSEA